MRRAGRLFDAVAWIVLIKTQLAGYVWTLDRGIRASRIADRKEAAYKAPGGVAI